jgi:molybdopterin converting factor small subunit
MRIHLLAFGIARDILGTSSMEYDFQGIYIGDLRNALQKTHQDFRSLASIAFAVNDGYVQDSYQLQEGDEVVIIPPVSGG